MTYQSGKVHSKFYKGIVKDFLGLVNSFFSINSYYSTSSSSAGKTQPGKTYVYYAFYYAALSPLRAIVRHQRNHIGNIAVQRFANLDKGLHGDMLPFAHIGDVICSQMRLEP